MRSLSILILLMISTIVIASPVWAKGSNFKGRFSVGAGVNQATKNQANETLCLSVKERMHTWEYGMDACTSEDRGGVGKNNFGFIWATYYDDFQRPQWQDYGIYAGAGAGVFVLQQDFVDWPAGPFVVVGWDLSEQAGLEGKLGYFGENLWGTANMYWYFK